MTFRKEYRFALEVVKSIFIDEKGNGFDYENQAWIENGLYIPCAHAVPCDCYGTVNAGKLISVK